MNCKCETVKVYDGVWQCMLCRRRFIPIDICGECEHSKTPEQKPVKDNK